VLYLIKLAEKLEKELVKAGRLEWAQDDFESLSARRWPDREFDELGYLRIKGARALEPVELAVLRELYLLRDKRAREIDRPPFKVLGNRTLLEISHAQAADLDHLSEIKGITDLILKRLGKDLVAAVKKGLRKPHGPIPKLETTVRRRMDRRTERRLAALKDWRGPRAEALKIDPGVLCPNATLEAIAWAVPHNAEDMKDLPELKSWFVREFADEILGVLERHEVSSSAQDQAEGETAPDEGSRRSSKRSGRSRSSRAKARARTAAKSDSTATATSAPGGKKAGSKSSVRTSSKSRDDD
jgi:ribonuclease D